jgi:acyl-coenzyme A synthetase/AMP-(fatty) acid ligase
VVLLAVARAGAAPDTAALLKHCQRHLPAYMVPAHVEWRAELPRNPNGKIDRKLLQQSLPPLFESEPTR